MRPLVDRDLATVSPASEENIPAEGRGGADFNPAAKDPAGVDQAGVDPAGCAAETRALPGIREVDALEGLAAIAQPDCDAVVWRRAPRPQFQVWIDTLAPDQLPTGRAIVRPRAVRDAVVRFCDGAGTPDDPDRAQLVDDITALADEVAKSMVSPFLRVRLDVVSNNACSKFHIDAVRARLICTYRGTGTQIGRLAADDARGTDPADIRTVPTGAPTILRGTLWPSRHAPPLLHRSPPIKGTGETRLLLVLDPVEDTFSEIDHTRH